MITDKKLTPEIISIQEGDDTMRYGINQDAHIRGMVRYVREDLIPNYNEMVEFANRMSEWMEDDSLSYDRKQLRCIAWLDGYGFAKRNWEYSEGVNEVINGDKVCEHDIDVSK